MPFFAPNIEKLKARRNNPRLIKALSWKNDTILHGQAAHALGEIGGPNAISALREALKDFNKKVHGEAVEIVARSGKAPASEISLQH